MKIIHLAARVFKDLSWEKVAVVGGGRLSFWFIDAQVIPFISSAALNSHLSLWPVSLSL